MVTTFTEGDTVLTKLRRRVSSNVDMLEDYFDYEPVT
jgi:hypothetical protein